MEYPNRRCRGIESSYLSFITFQLVVPGLCQQSDERASLGFMTSKYQNDFSTRIGLEALSCFVTVFLSSVLLEFG